MDNKRLYGLDILRILSMVLITAIHYLAYSGIRENPELIIPNELLLSFVSALSVVAVNIFILITGYFSCEKKLNIKRIITLWVSVIAASIILFVIFAIWQGGVNMVTVLKSFLPFSTMHYWFFTMYVVLMLISPFINILLNSLTEVQHKIALILGFTVISVLFVSNPFINSSQYMADYRGIVWLVYLYTVGAYIRKYGWKISRAVTLVLIVMVFIPIFVLKLLRVENVGNCELLNSSGVLPFVFSVLIFCLFLGVEVKRKAFVKITTILSEASFFVYIIQEHEMVRVWYWSVFNINAYANSAWLVLDLIISILALWPVAIALSKLLSLMYGPVCRCYDMLKGKIQNKGQELKK